MSWLKERNKTIQRAIREGIPNANSRCTGHSFGCAMRKIGEAMTNIEKPVYIDTVGQGGIQFRHAVRIIQELNLEGFYFNKREGTMIYSLDEDYLKRNYKEAKEL